MEGTYYDPANSFDIIPSYLFDASDASLYVSDFIHRWNFSGPLTANGGISNWTYVCSHPGLVFGGATISAYTFVGCLLYPNVTRNIASGTLPADLIDIGFDPIQTSLSTALRSVVPTCLTSYCAAESHCAQTSLCSTGNLLTDGYELSAEGIAKCWLQLCSVSVETVNADIAGIGILASYLAQSLIVIVGLCALTAIWIYRIFKERYPLHILERCARSGSFKSTELSRTISGKHGESDKELNDQAAIFIFVLADFHRAQCFFSIALQIATFIVLYSGTSTMNFVDKNMLLFVSGDGLIPIVANLYTLMTFASQDWYPIALSVVSVILSSSVGGAIVHDLVNSDPIAANDASGGNWPKVCGNKGPPGICLGLGPNLFLDYVVGVQCYLVILVLMSVTLIGLVLWKPLAESRTVCSMEASLIPRKRHNVIKRSVKIILHSAAVLMLLTCFTIEFYVVHLLFISAFIDSQAWGFGQIVGITIWSGSVLELAYLEIRGLAKGIQWRFLKGLFVTEYRMTARRQQPRSLPSYVSVPRGNTQIDNKTLTFLNLEVIPDLLEEDDGFK